MKMKWWGKMIVPMQNAWTKYSYRLGYRKNDLIVYGPSMKVVTLNYNGKSNRFWNISGLVKLRQDIRTCEYEDVHILWDMLKRNETDLTRRKKGPFWNSFQWVKHAPFPCRGL